MTLDDATRERLFGYERALDHPVSLAIVVGVLVGLVVSGGLILGMRQRMETRTYQEFFARWRSWCWTPRRTTLRFRNR